MWTHEAIADLYQRHSYAVFRRCRALVRDEAIAKDLMQAVFLRALEQNERFEERSSISTYLFGIATNLALNHLRDRRMREGDWQTQVAWELDEAVPSPEIAITAQQLWSTILTEADPVNAQIVTYHYVDGLSQGEIADLVGYSRVTVNQRLQQFRAQARQKMEAL